MRQACLPVRQAEACPTVSMRRLSLNATVLFMAALLSICAAHAANKQPPSKPIDLNAANVKELEELPGVGPVTAQRIIDMRQKNGRFHRVEDLLAIRGISQKKLDALRPYVTVSAPPATAAPTQKSARPAKKPSPA
jgi:competence ComEA-like helix-hairpin-helix protein